MKKILLGTGMSFDLLTTVEYGGCSAKLPADKLAEALKVLPAITHERLLVSIDTHDDAGVYKLSDEVALIQTTDFFPPLCSDPFEFGQISAANALSDVYAMGGEALTALNIALFPSSKIPLSALADILRCGLDKISEAGALMVGGHTIDDFPPKYGLAVTGIVHPKRVITNSAAQAGDVCILTKPLGSGIILAGRRSGLVGAGAHQAALDNMKQLNRAGAVIMQRHGVRCATDITGFGLLGHAFKMAVAGHGTLRLESRALPLLAGAYECATAGCIPGAAFRNQDFVGANCAIAKDVDYFRTMIMFDAQTSGGLFLCCKPDRAGDILSELRSAGYAGSVIIGEVLLPQKTALEII
ncbi:MAG: selenide, water dikinase SelD [Chitinivibrionales bacterium]|nr:selenide, water dikinase SelD [Chitinivibrionales bacterium]